MTKADEFTTVPVRDTESETSPWHNLAVRWLFPEQHLTRLQSEPVLLGRGQECQVRISGDGSSRRHATILRQGLLTLIVDSNSTNGTFVNGERVQEAPLDLGDVVRVGDWIGVVESLKPDTAEELPFGEVARGLWGGPSLRTALQDALNAASSQLPVLIYGPTGSGKEGAARAVHERSGRSGAFVAVNCGAIPTELAEASFFGHVKGAFTGAVQSAPGYFKAASGGTLFLDEITELNPALQTKLLRALQEQEVVPVGGSGPVRVDLRVVAACQESLRAAVVRGAFREDLYMRLAGVEVNLPPLRQRVRDIPELFSLFVRRTAGNNSAPRIEPTLIEALCLRSWPGNVRQLELLAQRLVALDNGRGTLRFKDLPAEPSEQQLTAPPSAPPAGPARQGLPLAQLNAALGAAQGNVSEAARRLGISRQHVHRLLKAGRKSTH